MPRTTTVTASKLDRAFAVVDLLWPHLILTSLGWKRVTLLRSPANPCRPDVTLKTHSMPTLPAVPSICTGGKRLLGLTLNRLCQWQSWLTLLSRIDSNMLLPRDF